MPIQDFEIRLDRGIDTITESGRAASGTLAQAAGSVPRPMGALSRPPTYRRLWDTPPGPETAVENTNAFIDWNNAIGVTAGTNTFLCRWENEGQAFLFFCKNPTNQSRGFFHAGATTGQFVTPRFSGITGATCTLLLQGLEADQNWEGIRIGPYLLMGNGKDPNLIYDIPNRTLEIAGTNVRPPAPAISAVAAGANSTGFGGSFNVVTTYCTPDVFETGPSGESNTVVCTNQDISVALTAYTGTLGFTHIRTYLRFPANAGAGDGRWVYRQVAEIPNGNGNITIASNYQVFDRTVETFRSNETMIPPPCNMFVYHDRRVFMAGNVDNPNQVWVTTQVRAASEKPTRLYHRDIKVYGDMQRSPDDKITALISYRGKLIASTASTLNVISAETGMTGFQYRVEPFATPAGPINHRSVAVLENGNFLFLGRDLNLYNIQDILGIRRTTTNAASIGAIAAKVDLDRILHWSDYPCLISDVANALVWIVVNNVENSRNHPIITPNPSITPPPEAKNRVWCYDTSSGILTGPISDPVIHRGTFYDPIDGRYIFSMPNGQLAVWDLRSTFYSQNEETQIGTDDTLTPLGVEQWMVPVSSGGNAAEILHPYWHSAIVRRTKNPPMSQSEFTDWILGSDKPHAMTIETQWTDCGYGSRRKSFNYVNLSVSERSSATLWVEVFADDMKRKVERWFGHVKFHQKRHDIRIPISITGVRFKIRLTFGVAGNRRLTIRRLSGGYELQGNIV